MGRYAILDLTSPLLWVAVAVLVLIAGALMLKILVGR